MQVNKVVLYTKGNKRLKEELHGKDCCFVNTLFKAGLDGLRGRYFKELIVDDGGVSSEDIEFTKERILTESEWIKYKTPYTGEKVTLVVKEM